MPARRATKEPGTGLPSWAPFVYPVAVAVPIVLGFLVGGPLIGLLAAVVLALAVVIFAIGPGRPQSRRALLPGVATVGLLVTAGAVLILAADGTARTIGWGLVAVGGVVAVALAFLEVGLSEDRERSR
jgi:hypothetical protein